MNEGTYNLVGETLKKCPNIFLLQYTFAILCISSLLNTAKQYFGDPIDCIVEGIPAGDSLYTVPYTKHVTRTKVVLY